jgi:thymidine kinase
MTGSLKIIMGSMFSGKSSEIIRIIKRYKLLKKNILAINHKIDNRYAEKKIVSHDNEKVDCLSIDQLIPLIRSEDYKKSDVIVVEEAQFFTNLYEFVILSVDTYNKDVVIAGLDGNFKREPFGDILRLIPHAESVVKLHALCMKCCDGTKASFTKRITSSEDNIVIGTSDDYIPVCRKHYNE